jgi:tetratricopeptide (TPR) repeat protein
VAVTWQTSVAQLTDGGRRLLEQLAWLAPEKVPEALLDVPVPGVEGENLRDAYDDLAGYSLVTRDAEGPFFLIHRLVQDVTRRSLAGEARQRSLLEAIGWINKAFKGDPDDVRTWPILDPLAPHARTVAAHADPASIREPTDGLMNQLGRLLKAKALHSEAEPLIRRALAIDESIYGKDHPKLAISLNSLAGLLFATGRQVEAESIVRRVIDICEKAERETGEMHPYFAAAINNLALLLQATSRVVEAESLLRRSLAIGEGSLGPNHPTIALRLINLAELLQDAGRIEEAEPLLRRALAIDEANFPPDHPNIASGLGSLSRFLSSTNRAFEAEPFMRRALAIDEVSFGPNHPNVARDLGNLAIVLYATNQHLEAESLLRRAIRIFVDVTLRTGHRHPRLDASFGNYAQLLSAMGKNRAEIEVACAELRRPLADASVPSRSAGGRGTIRSVRSARRMVEAARRLRHGRARPGHPRLCSPSALRRGCPAQGRA